jgi:hypothetical protein
MGNDHALEIVGIGTIKLKMYDGSIHTIFRSVICERLKEENFIRGTI